MSSGSPGGPPLISNMQPGMAEIWVSFSAKMGWGEGKHFEEVIQAESQRQSEITADSEVQHVFTGCFLTRQSHPHPSTVWKRGSFTLLGGEVLLLLV